MGARYQYRVAPDKCESKIKKKRGLFLQRKRLEFGWRMARWTKVKIEEYEEEKYMEGIVWEKSKMSLGFPGGSVEKNSSAIARDEH